MRRFVTGYASGIFIATLLCLAFTAPAAAKIIAEIQAMIPGPICNNDRTLVRFIMGNTAYAAHGCGII
jgi:hypothetical protein